MAAAISKQSTIEALLTVTSSKGEESIRTFDKAWHRSLELPMPVRVSFIKFVRKEPS